MADPSQPGLFGIQGLTRTKAWIVSGLLTALIGVLIPSSSDSAPQINPPVALKTPAQILNSQANTVREMQVEHAVPTLPNDHEIEIQASAGSDWSIPKTLQSNPFSWVDAQVSSAMAQILPESIANSLIQPTSPESSSPATQNSSESASSQLQQVQSEMQVTAVYRDSQQWVAVVNNKQVRPGQMWNDQVRIAEISHSGLVLEWID